MMPGVHIGENGRLASIEHRFGDTLERNVGYIGVAAKTHGQRVSERNRVSPVHYSGKTRQKSGPEIVRPLQGLSQLDTVLGLAMAGRQVFSTGKGNEEGLALGV